MRYAFIGLGNMASAIIKGMVGSGKFPVSDIMGYDLFPDFASALGIRACERISEAAAWADLVVLAVKPQVLPQILPELGSALRPETRIVSIAAGRDIQSLEEALGKKVPILRVMPNINANVGASTSAVCGNDLVSREDMDEVKRMFSSIGTVMELPEPLFSVFTAIASSAPAFTYLYIDALARAGVKGGMTRVQALSAAASAVLGSAKMVLDSGLHPQVLVDQVCSPGGTTIDGVQELQARGLEGAVYAAVDAVVKKDEQLRGR